MPQRKQHVLLWTETVAKKDSEKGKRRLRWVCTMQKTNVMRERDEEREERARGGKKRRSPREERIRQDETRKHEQKNEN
jgi:hypothetical protein